MLRAGSLTIALAVLAPASVDRAASGPVEICVSNKDRERTMFVALGAPNFADIGLPSFSVAPLTVVRQSGDSETLYCWSYQEFDGINNCPAVTGEEGSFGYLKDLACD